MAEKASGEISDASRIEHLAQASKREVEEATNRRQSRALNIIQNPLTVSSGTVLAYQVCNANHRD